MGQSGGGATAGTVAQVFIRKPERIAAAWRQTRWAEPGGQNIALSAIDGLVESFVREIGAILEGAPGSAWGRARGLLRLVQAGGDRLLRDDFQALRRCLKDAVSALGGVSGEWPKINASIEEAFGSAWGEWKKMQDPKAPGPSLKFGGIVVEVFDHAQRLRPDRSESRFDGETTYPPL
jgi:hypothetical protein